MDTASAFASEVETDLEQKAAYLNKSGFRLRSVGAAFDIVKYDRMVI